MSYSNELNFLANRANISFNTRTNKLIIQPKIHQSSHTHEFNSIHIGNELLTTTHEPRYGNVWTCWLSEIRDLKWENVQIHVTIVLKDWCYDFNDKTEYGDVWCLDWMKCRYNVEDRMIPYTWRR